MLLLLLLACVEEGKPVDTDTGAAADADTDADSDTDTDTDSDTDSDSDTDTDTFDVEGAVAELRAVLDVMPECAAAGEIVPEHVPAMGRGDWFYPEGGSSYDPRLAGCTRRTEVPGRGDYHEVTYDALGRIVAVAEEGYSRVALTYTEDGCYDTRVDEEPGVVRVAVYACDDHGYPLCVARSDSSVVTQYTNTYVDHQRTRTLVADTSIDVRYTWDGERVASVASYDDSWGGDETLAYTWDGDRPSGITVSYPGITYDIVYAYDDAGRPASWSVDSQTYRFEYDDAGVWPSRLLDPESVVSSTYTVTCP